MRGYKGMDENMKCRGMQYEVGKTYQVEGKIELCKNGLHFCEKLNNVFDFYAKDGKNRFFEVKTDNAISDGCKSVTSKLTIIRELSDVEINRCYYGDGYGNGDGYGGGNGDGYGNSYGYGDGYGNGYGDGNGYGNGDGYGDGDGNGYGYDDGNGYGYGDGNGYGYGDGNGNGYGNGYGDGNGNGYGDGNGYDVQKILNFI